MRILELTGLPIGQLQITISCFGPYSLDVSAKSPLDFTYQLLSVDNNETGAINSIQGNPTKGRPLLLSMEIKGNNNISSLDSVTLLNEEGLAMETFPVTRGEGLYGNSFYSTLIPSNSFRIQVSGRDKDRNTFVRVKPTFYTLEEVELRTGSEVNSSTFTLHPGELHRVPVKLENIGREKTLYITSSDDKSYVQYTKPSNVTVNGNSFAMTDVYLKAPVNATYGETTTVTVFVSERPDQNIPMNFLVFYLTVASKKVDVVPPSCEVLRMSGSCNRVHNTPNCINSNWTAEVRISDRGQGIVSVAARSLGNSSFRVEPFIKGQENNSVNALYTSSCCYTRVTIIGLDKVGNMGKCQISIVQDIVNLKGKLTGNVTEIVLIPGETTETPFMVTNLGTRGFYSFSAHVMQSKSMFSYVRPLGFVIESNRSRECQLITMAQREDICKLRTVTVSATLQSGNLNNRTGTSKSLTLFSINTWTVMNAPAGSVGSKALSVCVEEKEVNISCGGSIRVNFSVTSFAPTKTALEMKVAKELYVTSTLYPQSIHLGYKETGMASVLISAKKTSTVPRLVFVAVNASAAEVDENETILFNISVKLNPCTVKAPSTPSNWTTAMMIGIPVAAGFILFVVLFAVCYCKYYKRNVQSESKLEMAVGNLHDRGWSGNIYSSGIDNLNLQGKLN